MATCRVVMGAGRTCSGDLCRIRDNWLATEQSPARNRLGGSRQLRLAQFAGIFTPGWDSRVGVAGSRHGRSSGLRSRMCVPIWAG